MENKLFAVNNERVSGIIPTLESDDAMRILGEEIHDFPLAFISPLGSRYYHIGHFITPEDFFCCAVLYVCNHSQTF